MDDWNQPKNARDRINHLERTVLEALNKYEYKKNISVEELAKYLEERWNEYEKLFDV